VLGAQWGDEGKGKLVDILAAKYDVCARFNGGSNAGHTLVVDGQKFAMHLLPCGILNRDTVNVIGHGCVVHVPTLLDEVQMIQNAGLGSLADRVKISDRAHITFDFHQEIDGMMEKDRDTTKEKSGDASAGSIGTTRKGIGPTYASKMNRNGLRFGDLRDFDLFKTKYMRLLETLQAEHEHFDYNAKEELARFEAYRDVVLPMVDDTIYYVNAAYKSGKRILAEGANALMLDIDYGTYPMVTSSCTMHAGVSTGLGLAAPLVESRIGVVKAYTTRVGHGPFPTECFDENGVHLQDVGREFGTTTGRKRRCGWLDIPLLHYSHLLNQYSSINLTKLDVMSGMKEVKIGTHYTIDGERLPPGLMPSTMETLANVDIVYETMEGWEEDISECKSYEELPAAARAYVERIEFLLGVQVSYIGVGAGRKDMVSKGFDWRG
jgi:adenylosuccinate synthase